MEPVTIALLIGSLLEIGGRALGISGKIEERDIQNANKRIQEGLKNTMWDINEAALKASYHRDVRANMLSEGVTMGRMATGLAKSNIGVAGTQVPLFEAVMRKTDFDNQGYEMQRAVAMKKLQLSRAASNKALEGLQEWGSFNDVMGEILGFAKDGADAYSDYQKNQMMFEKQGGTFGTNT